MESSNGGRNRWLTSGEQWQLAPLLLSKMEGVKKRFATVVSPPFVDGEGEQVEHGDGSGKRLPAMGPAVTLAHPVVRDACMHECIVGG
jgi:hypothetical protein